MSKHKIKTSAPSSTAIAINDAKAIATKQVLARSTMGVEVLGTDPGEGMSGFGSTLEGADFGAIGMINRINIDGFDTTEIDVSTMNAPGGYMIFVEGMKDAKQITLELVYEGSQAAAIVAAKVAGPTKQAWTIVFPDGFSYVQQGYIKSMGIQTPMNDKVSQQVVLRMSGPPTFNVPS